MTEELIDIQELRSAVIYDVVSRLPDIGKTKVQKLMFLLQERFELPLACNFYLHQFGPYADEIESSISNLKVMGYISVERDPTGYGFHLRATGQAEPVWSSISTSVRTPVDSVLASVGNAETKELEVMSTIVFVKHQDPAQSKETVVASVRSLKPRFSAEYIERKYDELTGAGFI